MKTSKNPFDTPAEFEQFRWQTAAKILAGMLSNHVFTKDTASTLPYNDEVLAGWAVGYTDALIKQLVCKEDGKAPMIKFSPVLKESEDERIRKTLISYFEWVKERDCKSEWNGLKVDDIRAWLEKQKVSTDGDFARGYDCGYECCFNSHGAEWFEKQKEQKPAEWSEEDEYLLIETIQHLEELIRIDEKKHCGVNVQYYQRDIDWLKSLRPSWKPEGQQLDCLRHMINVSTVDKIDKQFVIDLYEQLKKL